MINPGKRQCGNTSMETKLHAVKELSQGKSASEVASKLGVPHSTVRSWRKNRNKIEQWGMANQKRVDLKKCTRMRTTGNECLNEAVFTWFDMARGQGIPVNGPMMQKKALDFHKLLGGVEDFRASEGWLSKFKQKYGIRCGEKLSSDTAAIEQFTNDLSKVIEEERLTPDQVFNCDETGIDYKVLPSKTLSAQIARGVSGFKESKDRVTAMACSNASGSLKLPLMIIGNPAESVALENMEMANLPVFYRQQSRALMNFTLFKEWFVMEFIPRVTGFLNDRGLPQRVLLIMDNVPSHKLEDLDWESIKVMFLPPNVTSLVQPMDQGVLDSLKRYYRYRLMTSIDDSTQDGATVVQYLKSITMENVILWLAESWREISSASIQRSWHKIWPQRENGENS